MKKILYTLLCLPMICVNQSCDKYEIGEYTPLPKLHIGETFKYQCIPENYIQLEYDSLGQVAVLNFHKEEVTDLTASNTTNIPVRFLSIKVKLPNTKSVGITSPKTM